MNSLRECIMSIVEKLKSIPANPGDTYSSYLFKTVAIWNDQIDRMTDGSGYSFLSPAAFVEINTSDHEFLGLGYTAFDVDVKIHILNEMLDYCDGTLDQDLLVFDLRNSVKTYLNMFRPTQTGNLMYVDEKQQFDHTNVYHYIISFKARMVDRYGNTEPTSITGTWSFEFNIDWEGPNGMTPSTSVLCQIPSGLTYSSITSTLEYNVFQIDVPSPTQTIYQLTDVEPDPNNPVIPLHIQSGDVVTLTFDAPFDYYNGSQQVLTASRAMSGRGTILTSFIPNLLLQGSVSGTMSVLSSTPTININWTVPTQSSDYEYILWDTSSNVIIDQGLIDSSVGTYSFNTVSTNYRFDLRSFCDGNDYTEYVSLTFSTI